MGLTLLPEEEMANFRPALTWVRTPDHSIDSMFKLIVIHTFFPGAYRGDLITLDLFRRKLDDMDVPYAFMVLCCGNDMFQVFLPTSERQQHIRDKKLKYRFPGWLDSQLSPVGIPYVELLNLTGTTMVKNEIVEYKVTYDSKVLKRR